MASNWSRNSRAIAYLVLTLVILAAVACGSAAQSEDTAPAPAAPAAPAAAAPVPEAAAPAPAAAASVAPTAVAKTMPEPDKAMEEVNPGKLTIMVGTLGNEQFDGAFRSGAGTSVYGRILNGFLVNGNRQKELIPGIASQWGLSADGLTWTFTIRKGVKFHDGSELIPEDVAWSLQHQFGPDAQNYVISGALSSASRRMDRIEVSGPDEVSVHTKVPITEFSSYHVSRTSVGYIGAIMPGRDPVPGQQYATNDKEQAEAYRINPIGAGYGFLVNHVPVAQMTFERFDDYYYQPDNGFPQDKRINFRTLDVLVVPEEATRVAALRAEEADIVPASYRTKSQVEDGGGRFVLGPEGILLDIRLIGCWNDPTNPVPCDDKRVRQALDLAIDKDQMQKLFGGPEIFHIKGWTVVTPSTMGYTPAVDPWPFDPDKARELLAEAGYPGAEGFGKLIVNTYPASSMPRLVESAQLAAELWRKELGLDVEVRVGESAAWSAAWKSGELNGQVYWAQQEARADARGYLYLRWGDPGQVTRIHEDPELFTAVQEAVTVIDPDEAEEAFAKLAQRLRDESHFLGAGYLDLPWAVGPRVLEWRPYPLSLWPSALHTVVLK